MRRVKLGDTSGGSGLDEAARKLDEGCRKVLFALETIKLVKECGSKAAAAVKLGTSPSVIHWRVEAAQKSLKTSLFNAGKHGDPTKAGQELLLVGEQILSLLHNFQASVGKNHSSELVVATVQSVWNTLANDKKMQQSYYNKTGRKIVPEFVDMKRVDTNFNDEQNVYDPAERAEEWVIRQMVDIALISYVEKVSNSRIKLEFWRNDPMVLIVPKDTSQPRDLSPEDIEEFCVQTLFILEEKKPFESVTTYLRQHDKKFSHIYGASSVIEALSMVSNGTGISIVPESSIDNKLGKKVTILNLPPYPNSNQRLQRPLSFIYLSGREESSYIREFIDCVVQSPSAGASVRRVQAAPLSSAPGNCVVTPPVVLPGGGA